MEKMDKIVSLEKVVDSGFRVQMYNLMEDAHRQLIRSLKLTSMLGASMSTMLVRFSAGRSLSPQNLPVIWL
jgi:hypothetical protein